MRFPLSIETALNLEEKIKGADDITFLVLKELARDEEIQCKIMKKIKELRLDEKIQKISG